MLKIVRNLLFRLDERRYEKEALKKAVLSYPPRQVTIAISSACGNRCLFCGFHSEDAKDGRSNVSGLAYSLGLEDFKRMVDMCWKGRVPRVHICSTGEPFLHKNILEMIDYVIAVYGKVSFQTNMDRRILDKGGYLEKIIERKDGISQITTDILSGDPETHNMLKRGSDLEATLGVMEYISRRAEISIEAHLILMKQNYKGIDRLLDELIRRKIGCHLAIVNLHSYGFNSWTSPDMRYKSGDTEITDVLKAAQAKGKQHGIAVTIPVPSDRPTGICGLFWTRFQTWPVKGIDKDRYAENIIPGGCNAVVNGGLNTLGYFFDYDNILDLWNNEYFVRHRANLLKGVYPDEECKACQAYIKKD